MEWRCGLAGSTSLEHRCFEHMYKCMFEKGAFLLHICDIFVATKTLLRPQEILLTCEKNGIISVSFLKFGKAILIEAFIMMPKQDMHT